MLQVEETSTDSDEILFERYGIGDAKIKTVIIVNITELNNQP